MSFGDNINIAIIGAGRFGVLWANLLARINKDYPNKKLSINVYDIKNQENSNLDQCCNLIDISQIREAELIFFCVPISNLQNSLEECKSFIGSRTIVCDTCSVKVLPMSWMKSTLPDEQEIFGLHPLFGPDSIDDNICRRIVVCSDANDSNKYKLILDFLSLIKDSTIIKMSAEAHDRQALFSQGITHLLGRTLDKLHLKNSEVTTKGYESLLEIITQTCNDSSSLFYDLQIYNLNSSEMWDELTHALQLTIEEIKRYSDKKNGNIL